jgi:hypothetical protein
MICPVCGYEYLQNDAVNHGICPSCGTEFGYDDVSLSHEALRADWLRNGGPWFDDSVERPQNWDPLNQVMKAFYPLRFRGQSDARSANFRIDNLTVRSNVQFSAILKAA